MKRQSDKSHWDKVYDTRPENEVSWFQPYPKTSIEFVELFDLPVNANIIDIGGGDSHFVDAILESIWNGLFYDEYTNRTPKF